MGLTYHGRVFGWGGRDLPWARCDSLHYGEPLGLEVVVGGGCGGEGEGGGGGVAGSHTLHVLLGTSGGGRERDRERERREGGRERERGRKEGGREGAMNYSECTASGYALGGLQGEYCHRGRGGPEGWSRGRSGTAAAAAGMTA